MKLVGRIVVLARALILVASVAGIGCRPTKADSAKLDAELLQAARKGETSSVQHWLQLGAKIEARDEGGFTALGLAADCGHSETARLLLKKGADPVAGGLVGTIALVKAAAEGNPAKLALVLERGADSDTINKALFAMGESRPLVLEVIPVAALIQGRPQQDQNEVPGFRFINDSQTVKLLLEHGASIDARDEEGATPLIRAAEHGQTGVVRTLSDNGAQVDARDKYGSTALIAAGCECAVIDMPETLESIKLLLEHGADVNARSKSRATALLAAASAGRAANIELLLDKGADIEARDSQGDTALLISAAGSGLPSAAATRTLLDRRANIKARNNDGETALILAASRGGYEDVDNVKLLLSRGAEVGAKDNRGHTALALALKRYRSDVVSLLRKAMASHGP